MVRASTKESNPEGKGMIAAGRYHFFITGAEAKQYGDRVTVEVDMEVIAAGSPDLVGQTHKEFFQTEGKAVSRFFTLACAVGLITRDEWKAAKDAGTDLDINEEEMTGRTFCGEIRYEEYQGNKESNKGKSFPHLAFRIWSPLDKEAADIPKDAATMEMLGAAAPAAANGGNGAASPGSTPAPAGAAAGGDWGALV